MGGLLRFDGDGEGSGLSGKRSRPGGLVQGALRLRGHLGAAGLVALSFRIFGSMVLVLPSESRDRESSGDTGRDPAVSNAEHQRPPRARRAAHLRKATPPQTDRAAAANA